MEQADMIIILRFALIVGFNFATWKAVTAFQRVLQHYGIIEHAP